MLFERPAGGQRAALLHVRFGAAPEQERMDELIELARSAEMEVVLRLFARRVAPHPRWFIGTGKLAELQLELQASDASVLVVNHNLSPSQQRNLETHLECGVLTRTELILNIFAARARTHEGQLQVELAQCRHAQTRLVRGWTHLDRQKGGVGMRGAGEKQIELDQRMLDDRIKTLSSKLKMVHGRRTQGRKRRRRAQRPTVVLVGYTNAGKSSLFNRLTQATAVAEDKLFATLDPLMRQLQVPGVGQVVLADTVGFIRDLPHALVEAFQATLEEVRDADLLLNVVDISDTAAAEQQRHVMVVLRELQAQSVPSIKVFNKVDLLGAEGLLGACENEGSEQGFRVSAHTGEGLEALLQGIAVALGAGAGPLQIELGPTQGRLRAWLYELAAVRAERITEAGGWQLSVRIDAAGQRQLAAEGVVMSQGPLGGRISPGA